MAIQIKELKRLVNRVKRMPVTIQREVDKTLKAGAYEINAMAVRNIKANDSIGVSGGGGGLLGSQIVVPIEKGEFRGYRVMNTAPYAPYVEFGTGSRVSVPSEWSAYAMQFKGKRVGGGNLDDFLISIAQWVRAKGITGRYSVKTRRRLGSKSTQEQEDLEAAYPIFLSILRNGAKAHPFLYPAYVAGVKKIIQDVKLAIAAAMKK